MKKSTRALPIRLLLSVALVTQLMLFAPSAKAAVNFPTSKCEGTLTVKRDAVTILTRAITFIVIGAVTSFSFSYSLGIYSVSASGTCTPR